MGQNLAGAEVGAGVYGLGASGTELKHGVVMDGGRAVHLFRVWKDDPPTAGASAQRSERYFSGEGQTIPQNTDVWFAVRVKASQWDANTRRIIWQWHDNGAGDGLSPHLSATVDGGRMRLILLHNENDAPTSANTTQEVIYTDENWQSDTWYDFVIQARVDPLPGGVGYCRAWVNGLKVADYAGPFGYKYANPADYAKVGLYHWNSDTNQWQPGAPETIETHVAAAVLLRGGVGIGPVSVRELLL